VYLLTKSQIFNNIQTRIPWIFNKLHSGNPFRLVREIFGIFGLVDYPPPETVVIEVTNACNLNCLMCGNRHMIRKMGYMEYALFKKIIIHIKDYVKKVRLYSTGEPTLHPNLLEMIDYAHSAGIKNVSVSTNATLLDEELSEKLLKNNFTPELLQFSVEGWSPDTYEKYREGAKFSNVYNNISNFYKLRTRYKKNRPKISIHLLLTTDTNIDDFCKLWGNWCDKIHVDIMKPPRFFETPLELKNKLFPMDRYSGCNQPFSTVTISYDGRVGACCGDFNFKLEMGKLRKKSLLSIWRNKEYTDLRKALLFGKSSDSICGNCPSLYYSYYEEIKRAQLKVDTLVKSYHPLSQAIKQDADGAVYDSRKNLETSVERI